MKFGGVVRVWGVVKDYVRGVGEIPWFLYCPFHNYFTRYMLQTCYVDENHHFLNIISQKSCENPMFLRFLAKNRFLLICMYYIFNTSKFARARWLYDVIVTSYDVQWYSFWYQWIEQAIPIGPILVANIGVSSVLYRKSMEGVATTPFGGRVTKNTSGGRGLTIHSLPNKTLKYALSFRPYTLVLPYFFT